MTRLKRSIVQIGKAAIVAATLAASASAAHATVTPVLTSVTQEGALYRYTYEVSLAPDSGLTAGSKLSIFDFAGFSGGLTSSSPSFTAGTELVTTGMLTPISYSDDPNLTNITLTWNGPNYRTSGGPYPATNYLVSALSTFGLSTLDAYTSTGVKNNGPATGTTLYEVGSVGVPAPTPETATWLMMIVGFGMVGAGLRLQRKTGAGAAA